MSANDPDLLSLFFEDVARIPILSGMNEILPLTRRVMRSNMLRGLPKHPDESDVRLLLHKRDRALAEFAALCRRTDATILDVMVLTDEVDTFLDSPGQSAPSALSVCFSSTGSTNSEAFLDAGWRAFYRVAALPPEFRLLHAASALPGEIEPELRRIWRDGRAARKQVVNGTLRYAIGIARYHLGKGLDYLELVNEGVIGLMMAVDKYREWRGSHFQSYAATWIQQRIQRAIADKGRLIRVPGYAHDLYFNRLSPKIEELLDQGIIDYEAIVTEQMGWKTSEAGKHLRRYRTGLPPASLDVEYWVDRRLVHPECMVSAQLQPEASSDAQAVAYSVSQALTALADREARIMSLRYGLETGEPATLEEIGQLMGVTRERIRQLEAQVIRRLQHPTRSQLLRASFDLLNEPPRGPAHEDSELRRLSHAVYEQDLFSTSSVDTIDVSDERHHIEALLNKLIPRGTKGYSAGSRRTSLNFLLRAALEKLGEPTHYVGVLTAAQQIVPNHPSLMPERVYASLFYGSKYFLRHGNGVFGLVEWGALTHAAEDGRLTSCPAPLLPPDADPSAFFESVVEGQYMLQQHPLSARQFWAKMASWARLGTLDDMQAQTAFDGWYAAGLIDRVHFSENGTGPLILQMSEEMSLSAMRRWCVDSLCKRVDKMPELMASLGRSIRASTSDLQRVLFGDAHAGHDVPNRLLLLAAFGAVQSEGSLWRLTDLGRAALEANPPDELPDEDAAERETSSTEEQEWFDELDLFL